MKLALAQLNTTIGDFAGNEQRILDAYRQASEAAVDLVVCPELCITGYPPRDLLLRTNFIDQNLDVLGRLAQVTGDTGLLVGYVGRRGSGPGRTLTNSVALLHHGKVVVTRDKTLLPTYDVFDEDRYFEPATENTPVMFRGRQLGLTICEDIWNDEDLWPRQRYRINPPLTLVDRGAEILINISASPWHLKKNRTRLQLLRNLSRRTSRPIVFCNQVGGNDELVFDGGSLALNASGQLIAHGRHFEEDLLIVDLEAAEEIESPPVVDEQRIHDALVLGLRDYLHKCGFQSAVLGLSGGIDSAVTACLAVEALGRDNVRGISLPSEYSSQHSLDDARVLAEHLGIQHDVIPIKDAFASTKKSLAPVFQDLAEDVTEENIQARLRGVILMGLSNKFGSLLLTTGNKSELAVGYCTLYGDMCGGLAVINDVPKTMVYRLARWINRDRQIIPTSTLTKPPSAELRPDQTDQDSLPPYEELDAILEAFIVQGQSPREIVQSGHTPATVERIVRLIDIAEYKRRQAAPGLKVTTKAFGVGRRIPIARKL